MLKAVLWDFGGVLTSSPFEAFNRFEQEQGLPENFLRGINAVNPQRNAWAQFESSSIDAETFDAAFEKESAAAGYPVPGKAVLALLSGTLRPRMVTALKLCATRYQVACLTNNVRTGSGPGMAGSTDKAAAVKEVMALFDLVLESSKEGIRKPDPAFYTLACTKLEIAPEQAVFLDDLGINLKPARALGMQTIKVINEDQALLELAEITGLDLTIQT